MQTILDRAENVTITSQRGCAGHMQKKREDGRFNHEEDDMWEKSMRTHAFEVIPPHVKTLYVDRALHTLSPHSF